MSIPVPEKPLDKGGITYEVTDLVFASALMACGVPLRAQPKVVDFAGQRRAVFDFEETDPDKLVSVPKMAYAMKDPLRFMVENPMNPLSFALAALTTYFDMLRRFDNARAIVAMQAGEGAGPVMWFADGSRLHRAAIKRGMKPLIRNIEPSALEKLCQLPPISPLPTP